MDELNDGLDGLSNEPTTPAIEAARAAGIEFAVRRIDPAAGPVRSLPEAAAALGVDPHDLVKTLVVRLSDESYVFVLVPGDRQFSWPKLRALLGTNRLSMPDADTAREVTGYQRGTITPFGARSALPTYLDRSVVGRTISLGAGAHGVGLTVRADDVVRLFDATVADLTD